MQRRMRSSHRARAERGEPVGGTRPFGWQADRLTLDADEAPLLRQAAIDFIRGRSIHSIVVEWQRREIMTSRGNLWTSRSLRLALDNPRMCGWRQLGGELVRDTNGDPVVGRWEPVITPDQWLAIKAIMDARRGRQVYPGGKIGDIRPPDFTEYRYLLTGILRCGRVKPDGATCNASMRVTHQRDCKQHIYVCPDKTQGGCGGVGRRGDLVDFFISELVLTKMEEEATFTSSDTVTAWPREQEYQDARNRLEALTQQWEAGQVTNDHYFRLLPRLEKSIADLRAESARFKASNERRQARATKDTAEIRKRWYMPEEEGGLALSQKRGHVKEALHAVVVHPAGKGRKKFDPNLLVPIWREE